MSLRAATAQPQRAKQSPRVNSQTTRLPRSLIALQFLLAMTNGNKKGQPFGQP